MTSQGLQGVPRPAPQQIFTDLSVALTGFDRAELAGTGLIGTYYDTLLRIIGEPETGRLLWAAAEALETDRRNGGRGALEAEVIDSPRFGPVAVSLIKLWYLGVWYPLARGHRDADGTTAGDTDGTTAGDTNDTAAGDANGASARDVEHVVSAQGYREGLVWAAAGTHPMGAKAPGFGSWAEPPYLPPVL
ncbi:hypothetical protein [Streptomyces sp. NPDC003247]|uniref:hypothetical protein n=1 Tax=Streptomyces sp. NPDC003247 TaxID=3364677 RepID=UPI0036A935D2